MLFICQINNKGLWGYKFKSVCMCWQSQDGLFGVCHRTHTVHSHTYTSEWKPNETKLHTERSWPPNKGCIFALLIQQVTNRILLDKRGENDGSIYLLSEADLFLESWTKKLELIWCVYVFQLWYLCCINDADSSVSPLTSWWEDKEFIVIYF